MIQIQRWWLRGSGSGQFPDSCEGFEHCVERVKRSGNKRMVGLEKGQQRWGRSGNYQRVQVLWKLAMHCSWWYDECNKQNKTHGEHEIYGRRLEHRSRGVTTLLHLQEISSRDLRWHRRENGRWGEEVKLSCFLYKRVKPKNLERLNNFEKRIQRSWTILQTLR